MYDRLRVLSYEGRYDELAALGHRLALDPTLSSLQRAVAAVLRAYALLRLDAHRNQDEALGEGSAAVAVLMHERSACPEDADWATLAWACSLQFIDDHAGAETVFRQVLSHSDVAMAHRIKAVASLAASLTTMGRTEEAAAAYLAAAQEIDRFPPEARTATLNRDRERLRLNLAEYYLNQGDLGHASEQLAAVDSTYLTDMTKTFLLICQARLAMYQDRWEDAESLANQANTRALKLGYVPFRKEAVSLLGVIAGRLNRRDDQVRFAIELATLAGPN